MTPFTHYRLTWKDGKGRTYTSDVEIRIDNLEEAKKYYGGVFYDGNDVDEPEYATGIHRVVKVEKIGSNPPKRKHSHKLRVVRRKPGCSANYNLECRGKNGRFKRCRSTNKRYRYKIRHCRDTHGIYR